MVLRLSPYRPSSVSADAEPPSPRGRLISEGSVHFYAVQPYTPSGTFGATSPYTPGGIAPPGDLPAHPIQKRKNYARKDHLCPGFF